MRFRVAQILFVMFANVACSSEAEYMDPRQAQATAISLAPEKKCGTALLMASRLDCEYAVVAPVWRQTYPYVFGLYQRRFWQLRSALDQYDHRIISWPQAKAEMQQATDLFWGDTGRYLATNAERARGTDSALTVLAVGLIGGASGLNSARQPMPVYTAPAPMPTVMPVTPMPVAAPARPTTTIQSRPTMVNCVGIANTMSCRGL